MATVDNLVAQIRSAALDMSSLTRLRESIEGRIEKHKQMLLSMLEQLDDLGIAAGPGRNRTTPQPGDRKRGRRLASPQGKHAGLSVARAVQAVIRQGGGKLSARDVREAFDLACDHRVVNFTLLVRSGALKRVGTAKRIGRGRAAGVYQVAKSA